MVINTVVFLFTILGIEICPHGARASCSDRGIFFFFSTQLLQANFIEVVSLLRQTAHPLQTLQIESNLHWEVPDTRFRKTEYVVKIITTLATTPYFASALANARIEWTR